MNPVGALQPRRVDQKTLLKAHQLGKVLRQLGELLLLLQLLPNSKLLLFGSILQLRLLGSIFLAKRLMRPGL